MRIEKPIGKYSEQQAKNNLKKGIPIVASAYAIALVIGMPKLPFYIDIGPYGPFVGFLDGIFFMYGAVLFLGPYQLLKSGLTGERNVVQNISKKLGNEHLLFNDVLLKDGKLSGNIDHIIIGPRGIFAIETKHIKGDILVTGDRWKGIMGSPSIQAKNNARKIYNLLKEHQVVDGQIPFVKAIVVLSGKGNLRIVQDPEFCKVIQIKDEKDTSLYDYVLGQDVIFSTQEIDIISEFLKTKIN